LDIDNDMAGILGLLIEFSEVAMAEANHARSRPIVQASRPARHAASAYQSGIAFCRCNSDADAVAIAATQCSDCAAACLLGFASWP
jgi:hypothetical protein